MATREERFRQAAWAYFIYGILYMIGAVYLAGQGVAVRRTGAGRMGRGLEPDRRQRYRGC